jgi:hypothetical protein
MRRNSKFNRTRAARRSLALGGCMLGLCLLGCEGALPATSTGPASSTGSVASTGSVPAVHLADRLAPYPPGRWRLAPRADLAQVRLWASHILIRHREATLGGVVFGPLEMRSPHPDERTKAEARELAERIAQEAQALPERFAQLARQSSEDRVTQTSGGSLGAVQAPSLQVFPQVLDAFAALRPGEVSRVVETDYGFHVFQLRAPPPERTVNASHIVIAHDEAPWLAENLARGSVPRRSRAEALALALTLYEQARVAPREFAELAVRHSEHVDGVHGGDLGAWSTAQPGAYGRELELLLELPESGVAPPIDSLFGIEIVQRTPDRPREHFAMEMIRLPFDPAAPGSEPNSSSATLALAATLMQQVSSDPQRFSALQAQYCCAEQSMQWTEGQEPTLLAYAAERMALGEIAAQPIEFASSYVIARRIDPGLVAPPEPSVFQLPAPEDIDLDAVASRTGREVMQQHLSTIAARVEQALPLDTARAAELRSASQLPPAFADEATGTQKREAFRALLERVRAPLGSEGYSRYLELSRAYFRDWTLAQPF